MEMLNNVGEKLASPAEVIEDEDIFAEKALAKKMSLFAEFFANHPNLKKAANAATLFLIFAKGFAMAGEVQAAESHQAGGTPEQAGLHFIDDVKHDAASFEKIVLPNGMRMIFKEHEFSPDQSFSEKTDGTLPDHGDNLLVSAYNGSAVSADAHHVHSQFESVKAVGQVEGGLEPTSHVVEVHGHGHNKAEAIASALENFSHATVEKVASHQVTQAESKDHYQGGQAIVEGKNSLNSIVETTSSAYISSYEVTESHAENGGKYIEVTVKVTGGAPIDKMAGAE
ncbi:MAG TPA: hypothetical protein VMC41_02365 [Candidatus Nanoarchaeia archaeon]|nr:hypothetical protein [Candidatus Nanoarchaeia archaeon]